MKLTLIHALMIAAAPTLAAAQVPPRPTPAPAPTPKVAPAPRPPRAEPWFHFEDMKLHADEMRLQADELRLHALEMSKLDVERIREQAEEMRLFSKLDVERIREQAEEMRLFRAFDAEHVKRLAEEARHFAQVDAEAVRRQAEEMKLNMNLNFDFDGVGRGVGQPDRFLDARPRAAWAPQDPADSLYRVAREALNRGEYRRAAQMFNELTTKHPRSVYLLNSAYYEAFARYRIGSTDDLKAAWKILDEKGAQFSALRNNDGNEDVQALRARVLGTLAARGDRGAEAELKKTSEQRASCDREEVSVKAEALRALAQMDFTAAMPSVRKVLQRRDECTVELRRSALYIIARQPTNEGVGLLLDAAKNDSSNSIRSEAMRMLPRVAGDSAVPQLEELLKTASDESTQRSIVSALNSIDSERARRAIRTIIERNDAAERLRVEAISGLTRERENRSVSPEELNYVRQLYGRVETTKLKEAVLQSVGRVQTPENQQFLMNVVRNTNEAPSLRASALQRLGRMENVTAAEIAKLYEVADSRSMREAVLSALAQRKEPEGIDKIIDIAKKDTDPQIRRAAINHITRAAQNGNERAKKALQEFFDR